MNKTPLLMLSLLSVSGFLSPDGLAVEVIKEKEGVLDASDGGMAFVLATGDTDGNFSPKLRDFLGSGWNDSSHGKSNATSQSQKN